MTDEMPRIAQNPVGGAPIHTDHLRGMRFLREWIAYRWLRPVGIEAHPDEILIANDSAQALELMGRLLLDRSATVLMDAPADILARQVFAGYGSRMVEIPRDAHGPDMGSLAHGLRGTSSRYCDGAAMYFTNPGTTDAGLSEHRREEIAEEINRHVAVLVETFTESPIHAHGVLNGVILGGFTGHVETNMSWIWARPAMVKELLRLRQTMGDWPDMQTQAEVMGALWA